MTDDKDAISYTSRPTKDQTDQFEKVCLSLQYKFPRSIDLEIELKLLKIYCKIQLLYLYFC